MPARENRNLSSDIGVIRTFKFIQNKPHFALGEFVDNSIQSFLDNKEQLEKLIEGYKPRIEITVTNNQISVLDNCAGISIADEERAFMVAASNPNVAGIGTFGMGMKVSACWFSDTWKVETKHIDEDEQKTFSVDVNKILATNDLSIGPKITKSQAMPFTKITIIDPFKEQVPHAGGVTAIKDYLADIYRWFINEDQIEILYNGQKLLYEPPNIKNHPYYKDINGEKYDWVTEIPELDLGDGLKAWGVAYLRNIGMTKLPRGFGIFWKDRLVTGSTGDPWMPGFSHDFDTKIDKDTYGIYGGGNSAINQRLEGWIHISPEFEVPSTKNGVLWHGKDLVLMKKLKEYLSNCELMGVPDKKFDLLRQVKIIKQNLDIEDVDVKKVDQEQDDEAKKEIKNQKKELKLDPETIPITQDDPIKDIPKTEESITKIFEYDGTKWSIIINPIRNNEDNFYAITHGPDGDIFATDRVVEVEVNLGHPFVELYFDQGEGVLEKEGMIKVAYALTIAEIVANETSEGPTGLRRIFNTLLEHPDL